jgi:hypothetical protein
MLWLSLYKYQLEGLLGKPHKVILNVILKRIISKSLNAKELWLCIQYIIISLTEMS